MFNRTGNSKEAERGEAEPGLSLGAFLKEARLARGLELAQMAHDTSISITYLLALEEDNRAALPADVFSRGFTKIYAAQLGLAPEEAIRLFDRQWGGQHHQDSLEPFCRPERGGPCALLWPVIILLLLAMAIVGGLRLYQGHQTTDAPKLKGRQAAAAKAKSQAAELEAPPAPLNHPSAPPAQP